MLPDHNQSQAMADFKINTLVNGELIQSFANSYSVTFLYILDACEGP